jgi:hypothetical protein
MRSSAIRKKKGGIVANAAKSNTYLPQAAKGSFPSPWVKGHHWSAYLQINRTKINVPNINVLQINGSLDQQKFVEV